MNTIYLSYITQVAEGTVFRKYTVCKKVKLLYISRCFKVKRWDLFSYMYPRLSIPQSTCPHNALKKLTTATDAIRSLSPGSGLVSSLPKIILKNTGSPITVDIGKRKSYFTYENMLIKEKVHTRTRTHTHRQTDRHPYQHNL